MRTWHDEVVAGVQQQFSEAAEAAERARKRSAAMIDFWRSTTDAVKSFCNSANRQLNKPIFTVDSMDQGGNYLCSITYKGPSEQVGGISLDQDQLHLTITIYGKTERFTLERNEHDVAVAVHANKTHFTPDEVAEETIRSITQIEAGRKFQRPERPIRFEEDELEMLKLREL